jgi:putative colanic acid biosynthesis UDP-glucose lipid carrier transferase
VKRSFDITFSGIALIIGSPLLIILALITKLTSKGPIFYKSERIGLWGEKFHMFKFRSMHVNADEIADKLLNGDKHSIGEHDPRITNWGRFMRKTRLDELPQFFNVIKGDMSIVGPRPLPQYDVDMLMDNSPDNFQKILSIKPGITSMGQIKFGYASNTEENVERMNFDLLYLNKYSLRTDLWLIFQTAKIMIQGKGK